MQPPPNQPWQFSLRALLILTTVLAIYVGVAVRYPGIGVGIGIVFAVAGAIYAADRLAGATHTYAVRQILKWVLAFAWAAAGATCVGLGLIIVLAFGWSELDEFVTWLVAFPFAGVAIYCAFRASRVVQQSSHTLRP